MDTTTHRPVLTLTDAKRAALHARLVLLLEQAEKEHDPHAVACPCGEALQLLFPDAGVSEEA